MYRIGYRSYSEDVVGWTYAYESFDEAAEVAKRLEADNGETCVLGLGEAGKLREAA